MSGTPDSNLKALIRSQPRYVQVLQDFFGYALWNHLESSLQDLCATAGKEEEAIRKAFLDLDEEGVVEDWVTNPLYNLVDHLTQDHWHFRRNALPEIRTSLEACRAIPEMDKEELEILIKAYRDFHREFITHMEEEEDFLFMKILRTEASLQYPQLYPEVFKGSVAMYPPMLLHSTEAEITEMVVSVMLKVSGFPPALASKPAVQKLVSALKALEARVGEHAYLESVVLFPRARKMEDDLRKRSESAGH